MFVTSGVTIYRLLTFDCNSTMLFDIVRLQFHSLTYFLISLAIFFFLTIITFILLSRIIKFVM